MHGLGRGSAKQYEGKVSYAAGYEPPAPDADETQ